MSVTNYVTTWKTQEFSIVDLSPARDRLRMQGGLAAIVYRAVDVVAQYQH